MSEGTSLRKYLRSVTFAWRLRGPLSADPLANMLHALVLALAVWFGLWSIVLLPLYPNLRARLPVAIMQEIGPVITLVLLRRGRFRQAAVVYLAGTWLFATVVMLLNGGIRSVGQLHYVTLPILATWLLGYELALWTAGICLASSLAFACLELTGVNLARVIPVTPLAIWAILVQVILVGAVPVAEVLRNLRHALTRARRAQEELRQHQGRLEILVQQRTAELVEARDHAEAANRAKSVFLANMSHELRSPLNAILGFSAIVRADLGLADQHRKDLEIVGTSGEHLLGLIDGVLDLAKIEAGRAVVESDWFDLHALVHETVTMFRERAARKNLSLQVHLSSDTPRFVHTDPGKLRQVLTNLIGNAVKYTDAGSVVVRMDTGAQVDSEHLVLVLDVEDTGTGIAPEDHSRIFEPFIQGAGTRPRKGTGLGLSISRQFVQTLGGTIRLKSTLGQGSRFSVEVPVGIADRTEVKAETGVLADVTGLEPGQPDWKVLIVEDQRENWLLLQRLLHNAGFHVRVAEDGEQAIAAFEDWRPHFIWMDLGLPVLDGIEAARRIRELDDRRNVKIVAVTATAFASQRDEALAAGFDDFLRKPYRPREVFDCMARQLGVRYTYSAQAAVAERPAPLRPEDLAVLPTELRSKLEDAIVSLDRQRVSLLVTEIAEQNVLLGSVLGNMADRLAYTPILNVLRSLNPSLAKAIASAP